MRKTLSIALAMMMTISLFGCSKTDTNISSEEMNNSNSNYIEMSNIENEANSLIEDSTSKIDTLENIKSQIDWEYKLDGDNIILTKYIGEEAKIVVSHQYTIDNKTYTTVLGESTDSNGPFTGNSSITSVAFEDGVQFPKNKSFMFKDCTNITYVQSDKLFNSDTTEAKSTFDSCVKLNALDISTLDTSKISIDGILDNCYNLRLLLVKNNTAKNKLLNENSLSEICIIAENLDKSIWDYEYDRESGVLYLTKYKGEGKADPTSAYSIDGRLYTNVSYGKKLDEKQDNKGQTNSKPSTNKDRKSVV